MKPSDLAQQPWFWALDGQDPHELTAILHRTPGRTYRDMDEAHVLAELSRRRKKHGEPPKRDNVMTAGMRKAEDPAFAWLSELEWARYKELTNRPK